MAELENLKYAELRKLAKAAGIKANQKQELLIKKLKEYYEKKEGTEPDNSKRKSNSSKRESGNVSTENKQSSPVKSRVSKGELPSSPSQKKKKTTPKPTAFTVAVEKQSGSDSIKSNKSRNSSPAPVKRGSKKSADNLPPVDDKKTPPATSKNTPTGVARSTPTQSRWEKKVWEKKSFNSITPKNRPGRVNTSIKRKSQEQISTPEPEPKKRRSTFEKAPTPNLKTPEIEDSKSPAGRRLSSRTATTTSPGVKEMLGAMKSDMSDKEMKESLMSVIDKKVQSKSKTGESSQSSNIPRFAAFLKKRQESKPITPGNKDWDKIHKKNFEKFDSIDVYLQKKRKRAEEITSSAKKAKISTEEVTLAMKKLKSHKTPDGVENKFKKPRLSNPNKTTPFQPTVFSTKNLNFNFNAKKSPKTLPRKSPITALGNSLDTNNVTSRKSMGSLSQRKSMTTPFKFTAGNTLNNTITSSKKTFNLKESLAKPLGYKPHKGKLKPFEQTGQTYVSTVSATKITKNRENMKISVARRRADKKAESMMSRRGIKI